MDVNMMSGVASVKVVFTNTEKQNGYNTTVNVVFTVKELDSEILDARKACLVA
jgi:hypothetical protein